MKTDNFLTSGCFEWTSEEDVYLAQKMQDKKYFYKWTKIARHMNKIFPQSKYLKNAKQVKRRWQKILFPLMKNEWDREQAINFCQLLQTHNPQNKSSWQLIKKEFPSYSFKMLKCKYKQLLSLEQKAFILQHKEIKKPNVFPLDSLNVLCRQLEQF